MPNKVRVNEYQNENVIVLTHLKIQKGQFLLPFFLPQKKSVIIIYK